MNSESDHLEVKGQFNKANRDIIATDSTIEGNVSAISGNSTVIHITPGYNNERTTTLEQDESPPVPAQDLTAPLSKRSRIFDHEKKDLKLWTQKLVKNRLLILQCEDPKLLTDAGYAVATELEVQKGVEVQNQRILGFEGEDREELDANYRMLYDGTIETDSPSLVMVMAIVTQSRVFIKSLPTAEETAVHGLIDRLANENLDRYVLILGTRDSLSLGSIYDDYREEVDFLLPRLRHHYGGDSDDLYQRLQQQIQEDRWPTDTKEFFQQIYPTFHDQNLKQEIEDRAQRRPIKDVEKEALKKAKSILSSKDTLKNTVLFVATYFTGLSARDFEAAVICLLGDEEMERKVTHITGVDGMYQSEDRDETQLLRKTWEEKYREILDACHLDFQQPTGQPIDTEDLSGPQAPVAEFTDEHLRKALQRIFWTSAHKTYDELLERVFTQRLFFEHQSEMVMEGVINLIVDTAEADPGLYGQEWLLHLIQDPTSPDASKLPLGQRIHAAINIGRKRFFYRMKHLTLEMVGHEKLLGMVNSFLSTLAKHSPDDLRELLWRLRSTDRIDVFPWWKKLLNRNNSWVNSNVSENIVASALGDEQRLSETLWRVGEWLPEHGQAGTTGSERTAPGLITDLCLRITLGRREKSAATWPPLNPILRALSGQPAESIEDPLFRALASPDAAEIRRNRWRRHVADFLRIRLLSLDATILWSDRGNAVTTQIINLWPGMLDSEKDGTSSEQPGLFLPQTLILASWALDLLSFEEAVPEEAGLLFEKILDSLLAAFDFAGKRAMAHHWAIVIQLQKRLLSELTDQSDSLLTQELAGPFRRTQNRLVREMGILRDLSERAFPFSDRPEEETTEGNGWNSAASRSEKDPSQGHVKRSTSTKRPPDEEPETVLPGSGSETPEKDFSDGEQQPREPSGAVAGNKPGEEPTHNGWRTAQTPKAGETLVPDGRESVDEESDPELGQPVHGRPQWRGNRPAKDDTFKQTLSKRDELGLELWDPSHKKQMGRRHIRVGLIAATLTIALLGTWLLFLRGSPDSTAAPATSASAPERPHHEPSPPGAQSEGPEQTAGNTMPLPPEPTTPVPPTGQREGTPPPPPPSTPKAREGSRPQQQLQAAELLVQGRELMARGDTADARDAYARATRLAPEDAYGWANLGAAEMVLGNVESAERAYRKALQIDDDNWLARYNLGTHLARSGRRTEALEQLSRTVSTLRRLGETKHLEDVRRDMANSAAFRDLHDDQRFQLLLRR